MHNLRRILVPTDFSAASSEAIDFAAGLAKPLGVEAVDLIYVWHPPTLIPSKLLVIAPNAGDGVTLEDLAREQAELQLRLAQGTLKQQGVESRVHLGVGDPAHEILLLAESGHYDLIVLGTRGRKGLSHALLGSVAEKVLRRAVCPVITVHARAQEPDPAHRTTSTEQPA
jgi:nucleotide-binding universal stress UspA family protein